MTGSQLLILAIIIVFVVAFVITVWYLNAQTKQIIGTNSDLVEQHNTLLEKNRSQQDELEEQQEKIESLQKQQEEMAAMMREKAKDEVTLLRQQTQERRNDLLRTAEMSDEESFKTPQDQSDGFEGTEAKDYQAVSYEVLRATDDLFTLDYCNDVIVRRIIFKDVPVDKSVKFITVFHKKQDLQVTPQRYAFIRPSYVFTQTPKDNKKATVLHDCSARGSIIGESSFERWLNSMDGKRESSGTFLMTAGSINLGYVEE